MNTSRIMALTGLAVLTASIAISARAGSGAVSGQAASGNAQRGKILFLQCKACHSAAPGEPAKVGPNLAGIVGAKAGAHGGFKYSAAMKAAGKKGLVWDRATLDRFIADPRATVPGNGMAFGGVADAARRADIIAYLATLGD